jgi:uncharacterized protein YjgD (DUF1641 family)
MEDKNVQAQIDLINQKLDIIIGEIIHQQRKRKENEELKADLMRVGNDLYTTAVDELEEVHDYLQTGDILYLVKKLLRNVNNISKSLEQIENVRDFLKDFGPVSRQLSKDLMDKLEEFDKKGYFDFIRELNRALDNIVTTSAVEDVRLLADNTELITKTIKNVTEPGVLKKINEIALTLKNLNLEEEKDLSIMKILREFKTDEAKRGLKITVELLKAIGKTTA